MVAAARDNRDLQVRRRRLGLTQAEVSAMLGGFHKSELSRFEIGERKNLPRGFTRLDYERLLDTYEAGLRRQERGR